MSFECAYIFVQLVASATKYTRVSVDVSRRNINGTIDQIIILDEPHSVSSLMS